VDDWIAAIFLALMAVALVAGLVALGLWLTKEYWDG
jgi:hypothetical protein